MMKNPFQILAALFLMLCGSKSFSDVSKGYTAKNDLFIVTTTTPPALIYVTNSAGQTCGVRPNAVLDVNGILKDEGLLVNTIPLSASEQQNNGDPDNGFAPEPTTPWMITVLDGGNQTYTINLKGIIAGTQTVTVKDLPRGKPANPHGTKFNVLIQPGITNQIQVVVNSRSNTVGITPMVGNDGLLNDIQSACSQDLIDSRECEFLTLKAEKIEKALDRKNDDEALVLLRSFLCNLGLLQGDGDDDRDDRNAIKEPAYGIIRSDVVALLKILSKHDERFHFFDFDHLPF